MKGGHIDGDIIRDVLLTREGYACSKARASTRAPRTAPAARSPRRSPRYNAQGEALEPSVEKARAYLMEAIRHAPGFGQGHQPLGHNWPCKLA